MVGGYHVGCRQGYVRVLKRLQGAEHQLGWFGSEVAAEFLGPGTKCALDSPLHPSP